ncbi:glycosyltransferase family 4 protein [Alteromonadaceae bacterium BrNp21-10]|nr:glycosyltransferase family 4 protein [Alteromonadaceae bacterium BrNp21-10]
MNILTISSLYPNNIDFKHGVFVETRLRHLLNDFPDIQASVIAPVPWFPFSSSFFGEYAKYAGVLPVEERHGITIYHPRYIVIPKVGMYLTPIFMRWAIAKIIKQLKNKGIKIDLIDGHYFYPDGVAIASVAEKYRIPFTCTARGTDINLIPQNPKAKKMIQRVFSQAAHMITVCQALKDEMLKLGAPEDKVTTLRNGVDLQLFKASSEIRQQELKVELDITGKLVMSVGWLIERKGHYLVIDAILRLPDVTLVIAGDGPDHDKLQMQINKAGLFERVKLLGALPQPELNKWLMAADVNVLASSREGWANVLLESMASGTPVVATNVWGTPEVVTKPEAGVLVEREVESIAKGIQTLLAHPPARADTRQYAEQFDWMATSLGQKNIFSKVAATL